MRISKPSSLRLALAAMLAVLGSQAQGQGGAPPPAPSGRSSETGKKALETLAKARVRKPDRGAQDTHIPSPIPVPSPAMRSRAFEALRTRRHDPALEKRAEAARAAGEAQLAHDREAMGKRLRQALGLEAPDVAAIAGTVKPGHPQAWVPVLFVSSSMPVATLRAYAGQLERARGVLAFRGMPGGLTKVGPMAKLSAEILRLDPGCEGPACAMRDVQLIVDPILFRQHGVTHVPALGLVPGDPAQPYCEREEDGPGTARAAHLVYGDAALSGLLEAYARLGGKEEVRDAQARLERR